MNTRNRFLVNLRLIVPSWTLFGIAGILGLPPVLALFAPAPALHMGLSALSFWAGVFVISSQAWNSEVNFGTLPALLTQPIARRQLWKEKALASGVAVVPLFALHAAASIGFGESPRGYLPFAMIWAVTVVLSSMPLGFLVKADRGLLFHLSVVLGVPVLLLNRWVNGLAVPEGELFVVTVLGVMALTAYSLEILRRVRDTLSAAEITASTPVNTALAPSWDRMERQLHRLRPTPTRPLLNFVCKELRLLWMFWVCALGTSAFLIGLIPFRLMAWSRDAEWLHAIAGMAVFVFAFLAAFLPGVAFVEERFAGLHTQHMTLPISSRRVWLLRAVTTALSVFVAATVILVLTGVPFGQYVGDEFEAMFGPRLVGLPLAISLLAVFSLCWSTVGGGREEAISAAVGIPCAMMALWLLGRALLGLRGRLWLQDVFAVVHPYPLSNSTRDLLQQPEVGNVLAVSLMLLFLAGAMARSYRRFSIEPRSGVKPVALFGAAVATVAFLSGVSQASPLALQAGNRRTIDTVLAETADRVRMVNSDIRRDPAPVSVTVEDLSKAQPLSALSRRWLSTPAVRLALPKKTKVDGFHIEYDLHVNLHGGWTCTMAISGVLRFFDSCTSTDGGRIEGRKAP